jgi:hypothetical protein
MDLYLYPIYLDIDIALGDVDSGVLFPWRTLMNAIENKGFVWHQFRALPHY